MDGRGDLPSEWLSLQDARLNQTGIGEQISRLARLLSAACGSVDGGHVARAEELKQRAVVVFKTGKTGCRSLDGLGNSQLKEFQYLEKKYPDRYGPHRTGLGWKEIDARQFEETNALNRAHVYDSAISALLKQVDLGDGHLSVDQVHSFLRLLAYESHARDSEQFRHFDSDFASNVARPTRWNRCMGYNSAQRQAVTLSSNLLGAIR